MSETSVEIAAASRFLIDLSQFSFRARVHDHIPFLRQTARPLPLRPEQENVLAPAGNAERPPDRLALPDADFRLTRPICRAVLK